MSTWLRQCFRPRYRVFGVIFGLVLAGSFFFLAPAQANIIGSSVTDIATGVGNGLITGISYLALIMARVFIGITIAALQIFLQIAAYNGYIDSPPVIVGWYMVRDVANMFFVVALLAIAFGTMFGLEQYEWKKSLVKLVLAAVFINFSRLLIGLLIDASHIFTITFLDAIQGTAGGNLISMFQLENIRSLATGGQEQPGFGEDLRLDILAAAVMSVIFSLVAMLTMGAYLIVMGLRLVVLWVLIILSPLAFVLSAIPQTKSYADDFWSELSKYIIVAPVMVFFLWLAFATLGNGDINNHIGVRSGGVAAGEISQTLNIPGSSQSSVSLLKASTWENMSSFIITIIFLMVGLDRVQKVGTAGSSFVSGVVDFGKRAIAVGSGYAAARFALGGLGQGVKAAGSLVGSGLYKVTGAEAGVSIAKDYIKTQVHGLHIWQNQGPQKKTEKKTRKADEAEEAKDGELSATELLAGTDVVTVGGRHYKRTAEDRDAGMSFRNVGGKMYKLSAEDVGDGVTVGADGDKLDRGGNKITYTDWARQKIEVDKRATKEEADAAHRAGTVGQAGSVDANGYKLDAAGEREKMTIEGGYMYEPYKPKTGILGLSKKIHTARIRQAKILEKTERQAKGREELVRKRTTGEPKHWFQALEGPKGDAEDRIEQGELKAEEARSAAKTREYQTSGQELTQRSARFKDGRFQTDRKTMIGQMADHEAMADRVQSFMDAAAAQAKRRTADQKSSVIQAKVAGKLEVEAADALRGKTEGQQTTYMAQRTLASQKALNEAVAGSRGKHEEEEKVELEKKRQEVRYLGSAEGQHELEAEALLKRQLEAEGKTIERLGAVAERGIVAPPGGAISGAQIDAREALRAAKAEELATGAAKSAVTTAESAAKRQVRHGAGAALVEEEQLEKLKTVAEQAKISQLEEQGKFLAGVSGPGQTALREAKLAGIQKDQFAALSAETEKKEQFAAATSMPGEAALKLAAAAKVRAAAIEKEIAEKEAVAEQLATASQRPIVLRGAAAEIRAGAQKALTKEEQEAAKKQAMVKEATALQLQKAAELRTAAETDEQKQMEEAAKKLAATTVGGPLGARQALGRSAAAKLQMAAESEEIKEQEAQAKQQAATAPTGRDALLRAEQAKVRAGASAAVTKIREARAKRRASRLERSARDQTQLAEMFTATAEDESKALQTSSKTRMAERERTRARTAGRMSTFERQQQAQYQSKTLTNDYDAIAMASDFGGLPGLIASLNEAEQRKKTGSTAIARISDEQLEGAYAAARKAIVDVINDWMGDSAGTGVMQSVINPDGTTGTEEIKVNENTDILSERMEAAANTNAYVAALRQAELAKEVAKGKKMTEAQAVDAGADAVVNIQKGSRMPATVVAANLEAETKEFSPFERVDGAKATADTFFYLLAQAKRRASAGGTGLDMREKLRMFSSWFKVDSESWNDDFFDYVIRQMKAYKEGTKKFTGIEKVAVQEMWGQANELGLDKFEEYTPKVKKKDAAGNVLKDPDGNDVEEDQRDSADNLVKKWRFAGAYNREASMTFQGMAQTSGDTKLIGAHRMISRFQAENPKEAKDMDNDYWQMAQYLAGRTNDSTASTYNAALAKKYGQFGYKDAEEYRVAHEPHEDFFQAGGKMFTAHGKANGHWESVENSGMDDDKNVFRLRTVNEGQAFSNVEMAKRTMSELGKAQIHSFGDLDMETFLMGKIDKDSFKGLTSPMRYAFDLRNFNPRTVARLFQYNEKETVRRGADRDTGKKDNKGNVVNSQFAYVGGDKAKDEFIQRYGRSEGLRKKDMKVLRDTLLPMLTSNTQGFAIMLMGQLKHLGQNEASHGTFNIELEGEEALGVEYIKDINHLMEILKNIKISADSGNKVDNARLQELGIDNDVAFKKLYTELENAQKEFKSGVIATTSTAQAA